MEPVFFVYLLSFANGKVYVGMSRTDKHLRTHERYKAHAYDARKGKDNLLYRAWRKHGAPVQTILSIHATRYECALAEIAAIEQYDSMNPEKGYNLQPGGQGLHAPPGSPVYELMRKKVWDNPERRRKSSEALKGKPLPDSVQAAHKAYMNSEAGKAQTREITTRPEVRAKVADAMRRRMASEWGQQLLANQVGRADPRTAEGKARTDAGRAEWQATEAGKAALRRGAQIMRANPENETKRIAALKVFANSEENKAQLAAMAAKASKAVRNVETGEIWPSRNAAARALGVTAPTVGYWIKQGKYTYV